MGYSSIYKLKIVEHYTLVQYNDDTFRFVVSKSSNISSPDILSEKKNCHSSSHNCYCNYLRSIRKVRELALCNDFDFFVTLTISPSFCSRDNLDLIVTELRKYLKKYKRKNPDFYYLLIAEKHKDRTNYHFHGLMKGINSKDIYINKNGYSSCFFFDTIGFNSFSKINNYDATCNYITKYISKDICKISTGHSYFHSRGLKTPIKSHFMPFSIDKYVKLSYENDTCKMYDFKLSQLSRDKLLDLFNLLDKSFIE